MEHIVSRADLAGTESSPSSTPDPEESERFKDLAQFDFFTSSAQGENAATHIDDGDDDGLEFQLFAAPKGGGSSKASEAREAHKIRLKSPSIDPDNVGFVRPHRSQEYYFADALSAKEERRLNNVALTGDQVLARSTSPWPGSAYTWKVLHLPPSGLVKDLQLTELTKLPRVTGGEKTRKHTRPGKQYRIKLRKKFAAFQAQKDAKKVAEAAKEAAEREKRTRRNREKKVKKRAKEKAKKAGDGVGELAENGDDGDSADE